MKVKKGSITSTHAIRVETNLVADQIVTSWDVGNSDGPGISGSQGGNGPALAVPSLLTYILTGEFGPFDLGGISALAASNAGSNEGTVSACAASSKLIRRHIRDKQEKLIHLRYGSSASVVGLYCRRA